MGRVLGPCCRLLCFAPWYVTGYPCSQGLGIPNAQRWLPSNAVWVFISGTHSPVRVRVLPFFGKIPACAETYLGRRSYDRNRYRRALPSLPRRIAFLAVLVFSSAWYPQAAQWNIPSKRVPACPQWLHSRLMSFPRTSIRETECSRHFCSRRLQM